MNLHCPHCESADCIRIDEQKAQCLSCGEVFVTEQQEQAA
jgi:hypothetical protein